jgi:ATP/maltotriose-dependent transcriptional regulator MalT/DNA-binding SARP family transcriptional activator
VRVATLGRIARPALTRTISDALDAGSVLLVAGAGYGKTMALEEAITHRPRRTVWLSCRDAGGEAGRLLMGTVEGLRATVPGLTDVVGERLAASNEPVDVRTAAGALLAEVERLLVEPLTIVFDDAEEIAGSEGALALLDRLLDVRVAPLSLAIATRRPLSLKLAKQRAAGRVTELGPAELSFSAGECEELLRLRRGAPVTDEEVAAAVTASEGWPMGVAGAVSRDALFGYLAEEVLDRLDEDARLVLVDSAVPAALTPEAAEAADAELLGSLLRTDPSGTRSYHPLFRAFLLERLGELRSETERAELHARVAAELTVAGRHPEAIEHWIAAQEFRAALWTLAEHGHELVRTSPGQVSDWLERLPPELQDDPERLLLEGQVLWGAGRHEHAVEPLRAAMAGYRAAGAIEREWVARLLLADTLISAGAFEQVAELAEGWDEIAGEAAGSAAGVAWYQVIGLAAAGRADEAERLAERLHGDPQTAEHFRHLEDIAHVGVDPGAGGARATLDRLHATIATLEREGDPHGRLPYAMEMVVLVLRDLGERAKALEWLDRCERESERVGLGFVARDCQLQRALLLAQAGDLSGAELELSRAGRQRGTGWRGVHRPQAEAEVASLRGATADAVTAAQRALARVAPGAVCFRVWAAVDMAPLLAANGAPDLARQAVDTTLATLDERFPGERGRLHRARLLAARACLQFDGGEPAEACESVRWCFHQAREEADQVVRAHWPAVRPVLWHALADGAVKPEAVLPVMQRALPAGEALVAMVDHPDDAVRRAALSVALATGHPAVLDRITALTGDADAQVAAAAAATSARLRTDPPPLRFELLGGFRVRRAGWEIEEAAWARPMAARVVRFLLTQGPTAVPEDVLFDAFWSDRPADTARQHLAVAISRARKVLDLPGAEHSVIEARERTFRLRLRDKDSVDSAEFEKAAAEALAAQGRGGHAALERAAELWTGEPLPEDRYAPWSLPWRERLTETYAQVLSALVESNERAGRHHDAIRAAQALLVVDPLDEAAHRRLMTAYARTGRTSHALRQYLECRHALITQLGVEPSAHTSAVQARILAGERV